MTDFETLQFSVSRFSGDGTAVATIIDVNYVNVHAFHFYLTPILAQVDVKDIFYLLPLILRLCRRLRKFQSFPQPLLTDMPQLHFTM